MHSYHHSVCGGAVKVLSWQNCHCVYSDSSSTKQPCCKPAQLLPPSHNCMCTHTDANSNAAQVVLKLCGASRLSEQCQYGCHDSENGHGVANSPSLLWLTTIQFNDVVRVISGSSLQLIKQSKMLVPFRQSFAKAKLKYTHTHTVQKHIHLLLCSTHSLECSCTHTHTHNLIFL